MIIPTNKPQSPTRLNNNALMAAFIACGLVHQKLTKRKEQIPTPSHPTNIWTKLSALTKNNIKNENKEISDINRIKNGSFPI
jgi:hypothetical protein